MKQVAIRVLAMVASQVIAMWFLLHIVELRFLVSASVAASVALLVGLGIYRFQLARQTNPRRS